MDNYTARLLIITSSGQELSFTVYRNTIVEDPDSGTLDFTIMGTNGLDYDMTMFRYQMLGYAISQS